MATAPDPKTFWGYLIEADKTPSPTFEALLKGIADHIGGIEVGRPEQQGLTPRRLASFYRSVGGEYDALFLETPHQTLSFIYQSLGCIHTLQPTDDDFAAPCVPALAARGFVRWQTIQLLLGPEEHVPYLQAAVAKFDILDPRSDSAFPKVLPKEALPQKPDDAMTSWHNAVFNRLKREAQEEQQGSRERSCGPDANAPDVSDYFSSPDARRSAGRRAAGTADGRPPNTPYRARPARRRDSGSRRSRQHAYPEEYYTQESYFPAATPRPRAADMAPSSPSLLSDSASSVTDDDRSSIVVSDHGSPPGHSRSHVAFFHAPGHHARRHSNEERRPGWQRRRRAESGSSDDDDHDRLHARLPQGYFRPRQAPGGSVPPRVNYRGANVRWSNDHNVYIFSPPGSAASTPGSEAAPRLLRGAYSEQAVPTRRPQARVVRPQIRRFVSPVVGVDGRRYPTEGMVWR
ncbi:MAG: hypothetical protein M1832_001058 [Thelocarpon impressellum]|nr:MAG: hypothetical protein M1832_001058 [Thelocarpon impressellum]